MGTFARGLMLSVATAVLWLGTAFAAGTGGDGGYLPRELAPTPGKTGIIINIPEFRLRYYIKGELALTTSIAVGKQVSPTKLGEYVIRNKATNPTWYPPDGRPPVPPGPENPLGTRWMGLDRNGYGLHGTIWPGSIGRAASLGCIRMRTEVAEELFGMVAIGTPVSLVYVRTMTSGPAGPGDAWVRLFADVYGWDGKNPDNVPIGEVSARIREAGLGHLLDAADKDLLWELLRISRGDKVRFPFPLSVRFDGKPVPGAGITYGGEQLIALHPLATYMGVDLVFTADTNTARLDGQGVRGIRVLAGRTFAPPAEVSRILGVRVNKALAGGYIDIATKDAPRPTPTNSYAINVNGGPITARAFESKGRIMLPVRAIADAIGVGLAPDPVSGIAVVGGSGTPINGYVVVSGRAYADVDSVRNLFGVGVAVEGGTVRVEYTAPVIVRVDPVTVTMVQEGQPAPATTPSM